MNVIWYGDAIVGVHSRPGSLCVRVRVHVSIAQCIYACVSLEKPTNYTFNRNSVCSAMIRVRP